MVKKKQKEENKSQNSKDYENRIINKYLAKLAKKEGEKKGKQIVFQKQIQRRPVSATTQQLAFQQQQSARRQMQIGNFGSRAENLEIFAVNLDEVPLLRNMEQQRQKLTSPPHWKMAQIEKSVVDSFPQ